MNKKSSIEEVVKGCIKKDPRAQRELVNRHADRLYAICIRYMGEREFAKDCLQESFIRIFKYIQTYDIEKGNLSAWVNTIAIRQCLKILGKKKINQIELNHEIVIGPLKDPSVLDRLASEDILKLVTELPDGYRQVFNLHVIEGHSHKEIAAMIGIGESSARSKLSRAKVMLREKLEKIKKQESWIKVG